MILRRCGIFAKYNANVNCALAQKCVANEILKVRICERDEKASRAVQKYGVLLAGVENIGLAWDKIFYTNPPLGQLKKFKNS